jgi:hypothetical protein
MTLTDLQNKTLLESEIALEKRRLTFLQSLPLTSEREKQLAEMRVSSLEFQLKQLNERLDSQIAI